ncbi:hypothetical protein DLAC_02438 [Tieghemostelium lacteum]|uniref:C2 domain-containing protein n=1 Tax=Tieghemostelium lacteum TaxID=361077 RepID=A0A152A2L8_TIELA|nr:hypothetical protein DLAC_02438 [Tieghemostelium lacteum]|eukprot:KYR00444.1 hypothetical protein DLAC_02438 [Tieghemostelium lacteum]
MGSNATAANLILRKHLKDHGSVDAKTMDLWYNAVTSDKPTTYKGTKFEGQILYKITIGSGVINEAQDPNGKADGYVRFGKKESEGLFTKRWLYTSSVKEKTLSPMWMETCYIRINPTKHSELLLELWDKDLIKDDFIGSCLVNFAKCSEFFGIDEYFTVKDSKGKETGKVFLSIKVHKKFDY